METTKGTLERAADKGSTSRRAGAASGLRAPG